VVLDDDASLTSAVADERRRGTTFVVSRGAGTITAQVTLSATAAGRR
jgi:hypothetical protein